MHLWPAVLLACVLVGAGLFGVLARRNAVLVLIGLELLLNAANLLLVTFDAAYADRLHSGQVLTLFVITVAAAEVGIALAVVLLLFRRRGDVDLRRARELGEASAEDAGIPPEPAASAAPR
ncbi:MAG TPA: NADH-quinone oxidoreductase subunit NuoK [Actinomycetales bacterium]|nr:NADH-quinone oxidoreductase subunit NuoK [Actinomycetales bacterium]